MRPVRASYRDPGRGVFTDEDGGRFFRPLPFDADTYNGLGCFPRVLDEQSDGMHEVEAVPFVNHFHEWTFSECRDSALYYLELLGDLSKKGWLLSDAQPSNITYGGDGRFVFLDHGSLIRDEGAPWQAYLQFIREYAYPLVYLSNSPVQRPLTLLPLLQDRSWQLGYRPPLRQRLSPGYQLLRSALLLSSRRSLEDLGERPTGRKSNLKYNLAFMGDFIRSLKAPKARTRWGDYYGSTILQDGYLERKKEAVSALLSLAADSVATAVDFGASNGEMTAHLSEAHSGIRFIALESDPVASEALYQRSKRSRITPLHVNILQTTPAAGFDGAYPSLDDRLRRCSDLSIALGIMHHMMHEENLPFERIIRYFKERSKPGAWLIIEHIGMGDPRYRLIRNPNYPHPEDRATFENTLSQHYEIIRQTSVREERVVYLAQGK